MNNKPKTVSEYIAQAPKVAQKSLQEIRSILRVVAPSATESLKWGVPAFSTSRILFTFAAFKHHAGFYPTPAAIQAFKKDLERYQTGRASIKFPYAEPLPKTLIKRIAKFRMEDVTKNDAKWM